MMKNKRVFITGATGLLGAHLTQSLLSNNNEVVVLMRDSIPESYFYSEGLNNKVTIIRGDLSEISLISRILFEYEIDSVFHLGAQTQVQTANNYPLSTFESNIEGTWNLLESCRIYNKCKAIICASSDKAYGQHPKLPYTEEYPLNGVNPYDVSKSCSDLISRSYAKTYQMPIIVTRCGNIFGEGDDNEHRLIPETIKCFIKRKKLMIRSDGKMKRDYIYVKDVVGAMECLWEKLYKGHLFGEAFNISNEKPLKVLQVVKKIAKVMKITANYEIMNNSTHEIKNQTLDASKIKKLTNWSPKYSFEDGLKPTISWYTERLGAL